jgi:hypothetical protein
MVRQQNSDIGMRSGIPESRNRQGPGSAEVAARRAENLHTVGVSDTTIFVVCFSKTYRTRGIPKAAELSMADAQGK